MRGPRRVFHAERGAIEREQFLPGTGMMRRNGLKLGARICSRGVSGPFRVVYKFVLRALFALFSLPPLLSEQATDIAAKTMAGPFPVMTTKHGSPGSHFDRKCL